jgi:segregation and condensation protein B
MEGNMTAIAAEIAQEASMADGAQPAPEFRSPNSASGSGAALTVAQAVAQRELQAILEAMLFVSSEPLSTTRIVAALGDVTKVEVEQALQRLAEDLETEGRGIRLAEIAGGYRLVTKQEYAPWIKRLDKAKSGAKLSRSALESLAIIAYKQPIVRSEIEEIRGVETSGVIRTLLERKLIRIVGRKEVPGRPIMYGTTKFFLEHFGLKDLSQLPPLREFKELGEAEQSLLPMDETLPDITTGPDAHTMPESIEGVGEDAPPVNGEEASVELKSLEEEKIGDELKIKEDLVGEPVEQG